MRGFGAVAMILLFAAGFTMYFGSGGKYGIGFLELVNAVSTMDINTIANMVVGVISSKMFLAAVAVAALAAAAFTSSMYMVALAIILMAVANILFMPFTFVAELPVPNEIMLFIKGFFNLLLLIAILDFVTGREW